MRPFRYRGPTKYNKRINDGAYYQYQNNAENIKIGLDSLNETITINCDSENGIKKIFHLIKDILDKGN